MENTHVLQRIKAGLIVSCQALDSEPLHSAFIMGRMAAAAEEGGAVAIRANSPEDIMEIRNTVKLPVIGLYKVVYSDSEVYITPTMAEVDALYQTGAEIIALDATARSRPGGVTLDAFFREVRAKYPDQLFMADTSCLEEGLQAEVLGFDLVATTMAGYTPYTKGKSLPDYALMKEYVERLHVPIIAEGGIWTPEQLRTSLDTGVWAAVVGTAITRPQTITRRFVESIRPRLQEE